MIITTTALFFHVCAMHGVILEDIGGTWLVAAMLDAAILIFLIYAKYIKK